MNNDRFKKGEKPMGFLNPWIYSIGNVGFTEYVLFSAHIHLNRVPNRKKIASPRASQWAARGKALRVFRHLTSLTQAGLLSRAGILLLALERQTMPS